MFIEAVEYYLSNSEAAKTAAKAGRKYAEHNFNLSEVADKFEAVFDSVFEAG